MRAYATPKSSVFLIGCIALLLGCSEARPSSDDATRGGSAGSVTSAGAGTGGAAVATGGGGVAGGPTAVGSGGMAFGGAGAQGGGAGAGGGASGGGSSSAGSSSAGGASGEDAVTHTFSGITFRENKNTGLKSGSRIVVELFATPVSGSDMGVDDMTL